MFASYRKFAGLFVLLAMVLLLWNPNAAQAQGLAGGEGARPTERGETDDPLVKAQVLRDAGLSEEQAKLLLALDEELAAAYAKGASVEEMRTQIEQANQDLATLVPDQPGAVASLKWILQICVSGGWGRFRSGFGPTASLFTTSHTPYNHWDADWNWGTRTRTYTTSQAEFVFYHAGAGTNIRDHEVGCR